MLGEFAIIFAGVTLGLVADDWRQDRDDLATERVALQGLSEDLLRDSIQLEEARTVAGRWDRAALWARRVDPGSVTAREAANQLGGALSATIYQPVTSAYSSLKESGQLELIQDPEVRRRVVQYFEETQPSMAAMYAMNRDFFFQFQAALWPYFVTSVSDSVTSLFPPEGFEARASWTGFWDDVLARQSLDGFGQSGAIWVYLIAGALQANSELRAQIAARLQR